MSTVGTFETSRDVRSLVAIGGKSGSDSDIAKPTRLTQWYDRAVQEVLVDAD